MLCPPERGREAFPPRWMDPRRLVPTSRECLSSTPRPARGVDVVRPSPGAWQWHGNSRIAGCRPNLNATLFKAALIASRCDSLLEAFRDASSPTASRRWLRHRRHTKRSSQSSGRRSPGDPEHRDPREARVAPRHADALWLAVAQPTCLPARGVGGSTDARWGTAAPCPPRDGTLRLLGIKASLPDRPRWRLLSASHAI